MNLGELKIKLLLDGIKVDSSVYENADGFLSKNYYYGKSDRYDTASRPPQEILLSQNGLVTGITLRPDSKWILKKEDSKYFIHSHNECINSRVFVVKEPDFYRMKINKKPCFRVLGIYGAFLLSAFVRGICDFFINDKQCKFCSLNPTRKDTDDGDIILNENDVLEVTKLAFKYDTDRIAGIMLCGGSSLDRDHEFENYYKITEAIQKVNLKTKKIHILMSPPKTVDQFKKLKDIGVNSIGMSLELYDENLFASICPGKNKHIGYQRFIEAYTQAVHVFGSGNVYCVFVGGLESNDTLMKGMKHMCEIGVVPSINIFHPNPNSHFENYPPPEFNQVLEFSQYQEELFSKYKYLPAVFGFNRSSVDAESYYGYFSKNNNCCMPKQFLYDINQNVLL